MSDRHEVCPAAAIPPGERRIVELSGLSIGIFNLDGEFYALANVCPHQLGNLCEGPVGGVTTAEGVGEFGYEREGDQFDEAGIPHVAMRKCLD